MSSSQSLIIETPVADFSSAAPFNFSIWQAEVAALAMSSFPILSLYQGQSDQIVRAQWLVDPLDDDKNLYLSQIPLFTGGTPDDAPQRILSSSDKDASNSTGVLVLELVKASAIAGTYRVSFNLMHAMVSEVTNASSVASLSLDLGSGYELFQFDRNRFTEHRSWGLSFPIERAAGQRLGVRLHISRQGGSSGTARAVGTVPTGTRPAASISIDRTS